MNTSKTTMYAYELIYVSERSRTTTYRQRHVVTYIRGKITAASYGQSERLMFENIRHV